MINFIRVILLIIMLKIRWAYFHIAPGYVKFSMSAEDNETHFQHIKSGEICSDMQLQFTKESIFYKWGWGKQ